MSETPAPYAAPSTETFTPAPIRFRVYDPASGEMHYPEDSSRTDGRAIRDDGEVWSTVYDDFLNPIDNGVALLSTGLRDADGVEVFLGDICEGGGGSFVVSDLAEILWRAGESDLPPDFRVVGNVYEGARQPD